MAVFGAISLFVASLFWGALIGGYTLSVLWGWFVTALFGLPALTVAQAIGIKLVFGAMKGVNFAKKEEARPFAEQMALTFIGFPFACAVILLIGYIVKQFV